MATSLTSSGLQLNSTGYCDNNWSSSTLTRSLSKGGVWNGTANYGVTMQLSSGTALWVSQNSSIGSGAAFSYGGGDRGWFFCIRTS